MAKKEVALQGGSWPDGVVHGQTRWFSVETQGRGILDLGAAEKGAEGKEMVPPERQLLTSQGGSFQISLLCLNTLLLIVLCLGIPAQLVTQAFPHLHKKPSQHHGTWALSIPLCGSVRLYSTIHRI